MLELIRCLLKTLFMAFVVSFHLLVGGLFGLFIWNSRLRRLFRIQITSLTGKMALKVMGIKVSWQDRERIPDPPCMLVSNHMSYTDVILLCSVAPSVFITSKEMGENLFLGTVVRAAGCIFVERRNPLELKGELLYIQNILQQGFRVVLFAEATTSDGRQILPFKRALLQAACVAGVQVSPVCINYLEVDGSEIQEEHRDDVCYHGEVGFLEHFFRFAELKALKAEVLFLGAIQAGGEIDSRSLTQRLYKQIQDKFIPIAP